MPKDLHMRFVAVVPDSGGQVAIGPFESMKMAEGIAGNYDGGFVLPMLRCSRHGEIEERSDFKLTAKPPRTWARCDQG